MEVREVLDNVAGALGIAVTVLLSPILRPIYARWGARAEEVAGALPGDSLVPGARLCSTRVDGREG